MAPLLENRQHMVVVAHRLQIEQQWRIALYPQRRRGQQRAFNAMRHLIAQHPPRRTNRVPIRLFVVGDFVIQKALYPLRGLQRLQYTRLSGI